MPMCPSCGEGHVGRTNRLGVEHVLSALYVYPFRCRICGHRFRAMQWGQRYAPRTVERREYERLPTHIPVVFGFDEMTGEGVVTEISIDGCTIETDATVSRGAGLPLRMQCSPTRTLTVARAVVRSVHGRAIGIQFVQLTEREHDALHEMVRDLIATLPPEPRPTSTNPV
jgi:hypothetical protein